jgi:hypothetical protein
VPRRWDVARCSQVVCWRLVGRGLEVLLTRYFCCARRVHVATTTSWFVDQGVPPGGGTRALWNGERDQLWDNFTAARAAQERITGAPMPTLSPYLVLNHKGPRVGPRPEGHEAWCVLQDIDTMTFSEARPYELPEQAGGQRDSLPSCEVLAG